MRRFCGSRNDEQKPKKRRKEGLRQNWRKPSFRSPLLRIECIDNVIYYTFLFSQQLDNVNEIIEQLQPHIRDISQATYYRKRTGGGGFEFHPLGLFLQRLYGAVDRLSLIRERKSNFACSVLRTIIEKENFMLQTQEEHGIIKLKIEKIKGLLFRYLVGKGGA